MFFIENMTTWLCESDGISDLDMRSQWPGMPEKGFLMDQRSYWRQNKFKFCHGT